MLQIKIRVQNGLSFNNFKKEVFDVNKVSDLYDFVESDNPDFIIFGPYGNDIPPKADKYIRIGYFCENIIPDMSICEFAFGIPRQDEINRPNYFRIQWHGFDPKKLIKKADFDFAGKLNSKTKFCNFIYSHRVAYREKFFTQLSKYKKVDAPGKSMTNMPNIDALFPGNRWEAKRKFQSDYKFTLALENYVYPGYQTEKLYDSMLSHTIPVYVGDPIVGKIFNTKSFISILDHHDSSFLINKIEEFAQLKFIDILPAFHHLPHHRISRKWKAILKDYKMKLLMNEYTDRLVDAIVEIDKDDSKYIKMYSEPWLNNNQLEVSTYSTNAWKTIFESR